MGPKTPKKQAAKKQKQHETTEIPNTTIDYAQVQDDEVAALQAIYMEDYEEIETKGAWSKSSDKAFRLHLKAPSNAEVTALLSIKLTATYPKSAPLITLEKSTGLRDKSRNNVQQILLVKPKELLGEVMIYEIAVGIQDILEDEALHRVEGDALPTLEEERAEHEAAAAKLAEELEKKEVKKKEQEKAEEDRMLQLMVEEEMARRKEMKKKSKATTMSIVKSSPQGWFYPRSSVDEHLGPIVYHSSSWGRALTLKMTLLTIPRVSR
jgi:eukaryotic translation initiation factor 2-alpha kinase 4